MDTRYKIIISTNFGAYAEVYRCGRCVANSEQITFTVRMDSDDLEGDLRREFGADCIIQDERSSQ
jgi:hypothetical protein